MADEKVEKLPDAVTSYLQDGEGDLSYRLVAIGQGHDGNMDRINTDVPNAPNEVAADDSPVSEAGTTHSWDNISHGDVNDEATAEENK